MITHAKHILFITASRIGDAVLSFGVLDELRKRYPDARFTIVCGPLVTSLFEGFPQLEQLIPLKKKKYNRHWFDLWWQIKDKRFEAVIDLRNSIVSRLVYARHRYIFGPHIDQTKHKVEQNAKVIGADFAPSPRLWLSEKQKARALELIPSGSLVLGVGPTSNWIGKTWPVDRFSEIIKWMVAPDGFMPNARVAVFAAPEEEAVAHKLLLSIPSESSINLIGKTDPATAAACLARCNFYIGNDSGLMHCAAAAGIPTFGLFGPSYPHIYRPWGSNSSFCATPETFDELINFEGYNSKTVGCLMNSLTIDSVKAKIKESWPEISGKNS